MVIHDEDSSAFLIRKKQVRVVFGNPTKKVSGYPYRHFTT
jgi:hypothetical protein